MAAPTQHPVSLSDTERTTLAHLVRASTTEQRIATRAQAILWSGDAVTGAEIARRLRWTPETVTKWQRRWHERADLPPAERLADAPRSGRPRSFPPAQEATAREIACDRPVDRGVPLSRFSVPEVWRRVREDGVAPTVSESTVRRWLHATAIRPWRYRMWLHPRDPHFAERAEPVLDLYEGVWQGQPLGPHDYVLCADEKSQLQVLARHMDTRAPRANAPGQYEFEYDRHGTRVYLAALDVTTGQVMGRMDATTGIVPFMALVEQVMTQEPYASADRVFWITDGGPSHHPSTFPGRLQAAYANAIAVPLPVHASWLDQIEIYFSILQRKALTPRDLGTAAALDRRVLDFTAYYNQTAKPFAWNFTRRKFRERLNQLTMADVA